MSKPHPACPQCAMTWPDYHLLVEEDLPGLVCEYCGYWSADPEPYEPPGCVGHVGRKRFREEMADE